MSADRAALPADHNAGWIALLPAPQAGDKVLAIEINGVRNAEALAYWYDSVSALTLLGSPQVSVEAQFRSGEPVAQAASAWRPGLPLPFASHSFVAVVCRLGGADGAGAVKLISGPFLDELVRVVTPEGRVYLDLDNPWSLRRLKGRLSGGAASSAGRLRFSCMRRLRKLGLEEVEDYAYWIERDVLAEIIPAAGYRSSRNSWHASERLKEKVLGRLGAKLFAPAYGLVGMRQGARASLLSLLRVAACGESAPSTRSAPFSQFLVNPGKCFVRIDAPRRVAGGSQVMCVIPTGAETVTRRRIELAALEELRSTGASPSLIQLLPRIASERCLCGRPIFVFEAIEGATVDLPVPDLDALTARAFELLMKFSQESRRECRIGEPEWTQLAEAAFDGATRRYPTARTAIDRARTALRAGLLGKTVPLVWQHGDYKLENLIFDARARSVRAVIDFELALHPGLPMGDLLYLLCYRRLTIGAARDVLEVIEQVLLPQRWQASEREMLLQYDAEFRLTPALIDACVLAFVIHHVGVRFTYSPADATALQRMTFALETLAARLGTGATQSVP